MNATEHYDESLGHAQHAERLLANATFHTLDNDRAEATVHASLAQVHATLALACTVATALEPLARANLSRRN